MLRLLKIILALLIFLGVLLVLGFALLWKGYLLDIPSEEQLRNFELPQATEIYSSDSVLLGKMYLENRKSIPFEQILLNY